jgi:hypothetical protein
VLQLHENAKIKNEHDRERVRIVGMSNAVKDIVLCHALACFESLIAHVIERLEMFE